MKNIQYRFLYLIIFFVTTPRVFAGICDGFPFNYSTILLPVPAVVDQNFKVCIANPYDFMPSTGNATSISLNENHVDVYIDYEYAYFNAPAPGPFLQEFNFPPLPAGDYLLRFYARSIDEPSTSQYLLYNTLLFTIQAAAITPTQLPTLSTWGYLLLGLLVVGGMLWRRRTPQH